MTTRFTLAAAAMLAVGPHLLPAQQRVSDVNAFAARVRQATERYRNRSAAIADGYRLIGPDFPGMGEHWVNVGMILHGTLEADRPAVLSYAPFDGVPTIIGVGYAVAVAPGEVMPTFPAGPDAWHTHAGTVDDESFLPMQHAGGDGRRLAVVHAWVWLENPDGMFARDNWALPFARADIPHGKEVHESAANAVALAAGNRAFFERWFVRKYPTLDRAELARRLDATISRVRNAVTGYSTIEARDAALTDCWRTLVEWATSS